LGCGEGRLLRELLKMREIEKLVGMDVSIRSLEIASKRLRLQQMAPRMRERIDLLHGSLLYRDARLEGFDAAAVVEVVEHLDPPRLAAFERVLFECIHPKTIALTTPNREYNVTWEMDEGRLRHYDHRFEWTREEFRAWADRMAETNGYAVRYLPVGEEDPTLGAPTQMAIFELKP
ncbi:MAG: methyltransferase domain-containing protein, partial [Victivallales bacterium]|nr:methyltransferase domain-containing protein [Victivallales bacterium]